MSVQEAALSDSLSCSRLDQYKTTLAADLLREHIRQWQEAYGIEPEDSVETLNQLRMERDKELLASLSSRSFLRSLIGETDLD